MAYPASVVSTDAGIQHIQGKIFYQRTAIENLKANVASYTVMDKQPLPMKEGKTMQFFENSLRAVNTVPVSEGTPGAPLVHGGSIKGTVTIQQYADYMTFSDMVEETAYSPLREEQARELGYSAARVVDTLNYTQFDTTAAAITAARIDLDGSPTPEYMSASVARRSVASLQAQDVMPRNSGLYEGIFHPLVSFDYMNDNTAGGVLDILKYNDYGRIKKGVTDYQVLTLDGIRWISSTLVPTTSNYQAGGQTAYHAYVVGKGAFFAVSLSFTQVPQERNFMPTVRSYKGDQLVDPAGLITGSIAYNFKYATYVPPDGIARFRRIRCEASVT